MKGSRRVFRIDNAVIENNIQMFFSKKIIIYSLSANGVALRILHLLLCTEMLRDVVQ